jgi:hypothetical protein
MLRGGRDPIGALWQVLEQSPTPLRQQNAAVPADVKAVYRKCREKSPALRYAKPGDLARVFDQCLVLTVRRAEPDAAADGGYNSGLA